MPRFELTTWLPCVPAAAFDASLDIDLHLRSMAASDERAVGGVTGGRIDAELAVTLRA